MSAAPSVVVSHAGLVAMAFALLSSVGACAPLQARKAAGARLPAPRCRWGAIMHLHFLQQVSGDMR